MLRWGARRAFDLEKVWHRTAARYPYLAEIPPFKTKWLYPAYNDSLPRLGRIGVLLELGIYQGGSLILWRQALRCSVIGVDLSPRPDTMKLVERYLVDSRSEGKITCLWGTDQADESNLRAVIEGHGGVVDVVIDDASHLYGPTRRSFEILFPLVRPGGGYFIEDWAAGDRPDFQSEGGPVSQVLTDAIAWLSQGTSGIGQVVVRPGAALIVKAD